ncbi:MAG: alkaline phosphatase [Candidatus Thermoplasmatota archaeon]|nr:alkaline phosphatase [Candidatus Thermoplasmatota archaeon]
MKSVIVFIAVLLALSFVTVRAESSEPKNVIFMIGDGMGVNHITLTRTVDGELNMDKFPYGGIVTTHSMNSLITDSAAAGTALATGYKTNNGIISQTPDGKKLKTSLETAKEAGKSTGLVTTTRITHATPAVFATHIDDRDKENEIAEQLLMAGVDVLLGGGLRHFLPAGEGKREDSLNLVSEFINAGYTFVDDREGLFAAESSPLLGLFTMSHMSYELDREEEEPSVAEMTEKAIELLSRNEEGFFLMVEGGRIDHAAHANDAASVVADTIAFDDAVGKALDFAREDGETLVVVTADHSTGGLTLGSGAEQWYNYEPLKDISTSFESFAPLLNGQNTGELFEIYFGISPGEEEIKRIDEAVKTEDLYAIEDSIAHVVSARTNIVFTTTQHDGGAVPIFAYGAGAESFSGFMDNTDVGAGIKEMAVHGEEKGIINRVLDRIRG